MGYKTYGEETSKQSPLALFCEYLVCSFMAFTSGIGGWLWHWGLPVYWMLGLSAFVALAFTCYLMHEESTAS